METAQRTQAAARVGRENRLTGAVLRGWTCAVAVGGVWHQPWEGVRRAGGGWGSGSRAVLAGGGAAAESVPVPAGALADPGVWVLWDWGGGCAKLEFRLRAGAGRNGSDAG